MPKKCFASQFYGSLTAHKVYNNGLSIITGSNNNDNNDDGDDNHDKKKIKIKITHDVAGILSFSTMRVKICVWLRIIYQSI